MPCNDPGRRSDPVEVSYLCEVMAILEEKNLTKLCSPAVLSWWQNHSKCEEDRVRAEAAKKLSPVERFALGIDESGKPKTKK